MVMVLRYYEEGDSAAVLVNGEIGPNDTADVRQLDSDRIARYDATGQVIEYQFFNVRRHGVRIDDLMHREQLAVLFHDASIPERDWSIPIEIVRVHRRRRDVATG